MRSDTNTLIDNLVGDLQPVRPLRKWRGLMATATGLVSTMAVVVLLRGIRPDVAAGALDPVFLLATGLFLLLGVAASVTVIVMGRPQVGTDHGGWIWAAAMAALLPLTALVTSVFDGPSMAIARSTPADGIVCMAFGTMLGLITGAVLVLWLRRGAPTSPERAGLLTGIAAGSFGIFAFSFHCPLNDIYHIGVWHSLAVVVSTAIGRLVVPYLIRW
jgi:hypothetical protein